MKNKKDIFFKVLNALLHTAVLLLSLNVLNDIELMFISFVMEENAAFDCEGMSFKLLVVLMAMMLSRVVQYISLKDKRDRCLYVKTWLYFFLYLLTAIIVFACRESYNALRVFVIMYFLIIITGRVIALVKKFTAGRLVLDIIFGIIISILCYVTAVVENRDMVIFVLLIVVIIEMQYLIKIITISASGIKIGILVKIIRRTYAIEIMFGFLLMIFAMAVLIDRVEVNINGLGDSLWYCFAIVTTIGFGDMVAVTLIGRLASVFLGIYGIIVVSLITSIIVNFYSETKDLFIEDEEDTENKTGKQENDRSRLKGD